MEMLFPFVLLPGLGVLWTLNLMTFIERLHKGKDTHNQKVLGGFWTILFLVVLFYCFIMVAGY
ncbi:hypothetical protein H9649_04140 [Sporosarcina sp. Sa2YVA2]|uniref:Uncharacterized protein n=1 Tax=Sporosarcina quadrami TaxID=2762234 RepID=A0ABR8U7J7_9BACL|nr:hypothetical protein [Sporosarcina quadrami]MBD7983760.1 hypothetical protein [Sporosarcina quadrami]